MARRFASVLSPGVRNGDPCIVASVRVPSLSVLFSQSSRFRLLVHVDPRVVRLVDSHSQHQSRLDVAKLEIRQNILFFGVIRALR